MSWINSDRDHAKTGKVSDSRIAAETADLTFNGKLSANTTYQVGLNLASLGLGTSNTDASPTQNAGDNTSGFIDTIYVTRTLMEGLTLDIGKKGLLGGGFEVTHGTIDQYATSNYWTTVDNTGPQFGLTLDKELMGHHVMVQMSNGNKDRTVGGETAQSRMGWAAEWLGTYANGMLKSNVGYTVVPSATSGRSTDLLGAGLQLNVNKFVVEADYGVVTSKKAATASADKKTSSIVATVSYAGMETLTPFAKVMSEEYKQSNAGLKSDKVFGFGLGLQYKENAKDAIRYHAVYTSVGHDKPAIASEQTALKYTNSTIFVGASMDVNVL